MKVVHTSDTHWTWQPDGSDFRPNLLPIPECDVLVHSGDATFHGVAQELEWLHDWFERQPARHKILVPGNHDLTFEQSAYHNDYGLAAMADAATVLVNREVTIEGVRFYGTPYQPIFFDWAFNRSEPELDEIFTLIPEGIDVLVTHSPPLGHLDKVVNRAKAGVRAGSAAMLKHVKRVRPRYHLFGHIHGSYGRKVAGGTTYLNSAMCDEDYKPVNAPQVFDIVKETA